MKHWRIEEIDWARFDRARVDADIIPLVKAAAMVERNGTDYAAYLNGVFPDDPDFRRAADNWAVEEVQHGDALGRWAMLADPAWDYPAAFARYREGFKIDVAADASIRGSRTGELIARCMVEIGTSSYYTALGDATEEPVLKAVCKQIAADEFRHFKLFYDHMRRYLARENLSFLQRLRIAAGRISESEDDELAFAFHCGNAGAGAGVRPRALPRRLYGAGDHRLSVPPCRARHGHDFQDRRPAAARPAVGRGGAAGVAVAAAPPAPLRPAHRPHPRGGGLSAVVPAQLPGAGRLTIAPEDRPDVASPVQDSDNFDRSLARPVDHEIGPDRPKPDVQRRACKVGSLVSEPGLFGKTLERNAQPVAQPCRGWRVPGSNVAEDFADVLPCPERDGIASQRGRP